MSACGDVAVSMEKFSLSSGKRNKLPGLTLSPFGSLDSVALLSGVLLA